MEKQSAKPVAIWRLGHALAVVSVGLIAGTALAHILEMPHKLAMTGETWLPIQQLIYDGWGRKLFLLDMLAIVGLVAVAYRFTSSRAPAFLSVALLLLADVVVFLGWIAPTNAAVEAWAAAVPMENWTTLRANWEWGHAARAALLTLSTLFAVLAAPREEARNPVFAGG